MKKIIIVALALLVSATFNTVAAQKNKDKKKAAAKVVQPVQITTRADSISYAMGASVTQELTAFLKNNFNVDSIYMADVIRGFEDGIKGNPNDHAYSAGIQIANIVMTRMLPEMKKDFEGTDISLDTEMFNHGFVDALKKSSTHFTPKTAETYAQAARAELKEKKGRMVREEGERFLAENAKKEGVICLPSGLQYKVIRQGTGTIPQKEDEVVVKYEGHLIDGTEFDSSYKRNPQTSNFRPNQVIKGWTEALTMMPEGSKWELYIPQNLAYGERQAGKIPPYSTLIFTVELEKVNKK